MDTTTHVTSTHDSDTLDPTLRLTVERLLSSTVEQPCYRKLCRQNHAAPDAVYRLIDGLTEQLMARDELIKAQLRTIDRLRYQMVELVKDFTSRDNRPGLQ